MVNAGIMSGRTKQISDDLSCGHTLNLAAYDTVKQPKIMKDCLDTTFEISKLVGFSPKHDNKLEKLKQELAPLAFPQAYSFVSH